MPETNLADIQIGKHTPEICRITQNYYLHESMTQPGRYYEMRYWYEYRRWSCSCPDASGPRLNGQCKHKKSLFAHIRAEIALREIIKKGAA